MAKGRESAHPTGPAVGFSVTRGVVGAARRLIVCGAVTLLTCGVCLSAQAQGGQPPAGQPHRQQGRQPQPEFVEKGRQLTREGKLEEALAVYRKELQTTPDSVQAHVAAGVVLDLLGRGAEARRHFQSAIDAARTPQARASAQRRMAMSYAFGGDCAGAVKFAQQVFDHYVAEKNFFQQGETANEVARVCLEAGDFVAAEKWYRTGYEAGLKEPDIKPERVALWNFRMEHARARLAARRGRKEEARKHVAAAKALLDQNPEVAKEQAVYYPYLTGYVAFHTGDYQAALAELQKANQDDAFIQTLIGQTYEKLGQTEKAMEFYRKAAQVTSHNPPAAYARPFTRKKLGNR